MKPERAVSEQKEVLEKDIEEGLRRKRAAEEIADLIGAELHEADMNQALEEYRDLSRAEPQEAYDSSNIR